MFPNILDAIMFAADFGAPIALGLAWWCWLHDENETAWKWRTKVLHAGLLAESVNITMFCSWFIYRLCSAPTALIAATALIWKVKDVCSDAGVYLTLLASAGVLLGSGKARIPLAFRAVLGFLVWVNFGVL